MGATQSVLVARHDATRTIHAIERQHDGLYTMCRLGAWVDLERLALDATALCAERVFPVKAEIASSPPRARGPLAAMTPHMISQQKKKRAAIEAIQSLVRKKPKAEPGPSSDEAAPLAPEMQRQVWDQALGPMPEHIIPYVKQSIEETAVPQAISPEVPIPENRTRFIKQRYSVPPMPEVMIPHIKQREETPMSEVIPHVKHGDRMSPVSESMTSHNTRGKREVQIAEAMIPCVKPPPEVTSETTIKSSEARFHLEETKGQSSAMGAAAALPSSQLLGPAGEDDPQDVAASIFENIRAHYFEVLYKSMVSDFRIKLRAYHSNALHTGIPCILCQRSSITSQIGISP